MFEKKVQAALATYFAVSVHLRLIIMGIFLSRANGFGT